jgi:predicted AAA+ superfamily ATPase
MGLVTNAMPHYLKGILDHNERAGIRLADVFDVLSSAQVYKEAWDESQVPNIIEEEAGRQFDPEFVEIFFSSLNVLRSIQERYRDKTDDIYHRRLFDLLKKYFVTGGLPEVISQYTAGKEEPLEAFRAVRQFQKQLLLHYESDFSKYAGSTNSRHIQRVFRATPLQLLNTQDKKSKKFKFKDIISKGYRSYDDLADPIEWLVKAGLALKVNTNLHPSIPVMAGAKENSFKLFLFDIGLLGAMINLKPESILRYDYGSYKGYFAENFVLQELCSYGLDKIVTWYGRTSETEFVLEINESIIPVEVKAGFNTKAKSLQAFINKYNPVYAVKFTGNKFGCDQQKRIFNYPLYMILKFPELSTESAGEPVPLPGRPQVLTETLH